MVEPTPCPACRQEAGHIREIVWHCSFCGHWFITPGKKTLAERYDLVEVMYRRYVNEIRNLRNIGVIASFDEWYNALNNCLHDHHSAEQQLIALARFSLELERIIKENVHA